MVISSSPSTRLSSTIPETVITFETSPPAGSVTVPVIKLTEPLTAVKSSPGVAVPVMEKLTNDPADNPPTLETRKLSVAPSSEAKPGTAVILMVCACSITPKSIKTISKNPL